jgi:hypothetical protein
MAKYARNMLQDYAAEGEEDEKLRGETDPAPNAKYFA